MFCVSNTFCVTNTQLLYSTFCGIMLSCVIFILFRSSEVVNTVLNLEVMRTSVCGVNKIVKEKKKYVTLVTLIYILTFYLPYVFSIEFLSFKSFKYSFSPHLFDMYAIVKFDDGIHYVCPSLYIHTTKNRVTKARYRNGLKYPATLIAKNSKYKMIYIY